MKYSLTEIVADTFSNAGGYKLFLVLDEHLEKGEKVELSFKNSHALSSSFLNSSFGELIDKYGFEKFKSLVKPVDLTKSQLEIVKNYLKSCGIAF